MRRLTGRVAGLGIAVLVIVDAVLLVAALRPRHAPPASLAAGTPTASPSAIAAGTPAPGGATSSGSPAAGQPRLLVDTTAGGTGIRVTTTRSCGGVPAAAAVTEDGGASWLAVHLPVAQVLRVHAVGAGDVWVVGTTAGCTPELYQSTDGGATWSAGSAAGAWYLLPGAARGLHAPGQLVTPPCPAGSDPAQLDPLSGSAAYLVCAGPTGPAALLVTLDTGTSWQPLPAAPLAGEVAQGWGSLDAGYLARSVPGCALALYATTDAGRLWSRTACLPVTATIAALSFTTPATGTLVGEVAGGFVTDVTTDSGGSWAAAAPVPAPVVHPIAPALPRPVPYSPPRGYPSASPTPSRSAAPRPSPTAGSASPTPRPTGSPSPRS